MNPTHRFACLLGKLKVQVSQGAVICLQEVTEAWAGKLYVWFAKRRYRMISSQYHRRFTGYMGVAMAFPIRMEVQALHFVRPTRFEHLEGQRDALAEQDGSIRIPSSPIACSTGLDYKLRSTKNVALFAKLRVKVPKKKCAGAGPSPPAPPCQFSFCVVTYHFPCEFRDPEYMTAVAGMLLKRSQAFANGSPLIIAGDFNSTPDTPVYSLMTTGRPISADGKLNFSSLSIYGKKLFSKSTTETSLSYYPMGSAYGMVTGFEPEFTNYSRRRVYGGNQHDFCGTIDYIFVSHHWKAVAVLPMLSRDAVQRTVESYPSEKEPSDHAMIAARVSLKIPRRFLPYPPGLSKPRHRRGTRQGTRQNA